MLRVYRLGFGLLYFDLGLLNYGAYLWRVPLIRNLPLSIRAVGYMVSIYCTLHRLSRRLTP